MDKQIVLRPCLHLTTMGEATSTGRMHCPIAGCGERPTAMLQVDLLARSFKDSVVNGDLPDQERAIPEALRDALVAHLKKDAPIAGFTELGPEGQANRVAKAAAVYFFAKKEN